MLYTGVAQLHRQIIIKARNALFVYIFSEMVTISRRQRTSSLEALNSVHFAELGFQLKKTTCDCPDSNQFVTCAPVKYLALRLRISHFPKAIALCIIRFLIVKRVSCFIVHSVLAQYSRVYRVRTHFPSVLLSSPGFDQSLLDRIVLNFH